MYRFAERLGIPWADRQQWEGIDMGNGQVLCAEDVLEGHFRRLATTRRTSSQANASSLSLKNVAVQIDDNEFAAITVLAPNLAPLTELAEDVASVVPPVQPAPAFRTHLHLALEQTHRQQAAQRVLGTRILPRTEPRTHTQRGGWVIVGMLVLMFLLMWNRLQRSVESVDR